MTRAIPVRAETIQVEGGLAISGEFTGASEATETADSGEGTFITPPAPTSDQSPVASPEATFQTLPISTNAVEPSDEATFTTSPQTNPPPPGDGGDGRGSGGGGGSSGGGYGYRLPLPLAPSLPRPIEGECPIYLTKFIRLGADNDLAEVLKLQRFLRDFEELDVPVDGIYGEATFEAVKIFQLRYADAVLKPWGIDYPTGYVYITTTLAINNLYCERDPATTLNLRSRLPTPSPVDGIIGVPTTTPTSTLPLVGEAPTTTNRFLIAALGVFNFFKQIPDWWWVVLLLLVILYLVLNKRGDKRDKSL